jgi:hypothetical protein
VLGSALALATSFLVEIYKNWAQNKNREKDFKIILRLEAKSILETVGKLIEDYGQKQYFPFVILTELSTKVQRLDKIRDKVISLKNDLKKEEVLSLFNSISLYHSDVNTLEARAFTPSQPTGAPTLQWNDESYKSQRQILAFRGTDLKRNIQDLINFLGR